MANCNQRQKARTESASNSGTESVDPAIDFLQMVEDLKNTIAESDDSKQHYEIVKELLKVVEGKKSESRLYHTAEIMLIVLESRISNSIDEYSENLNVASGIYKEAQSSESFVQLEDDFENSTEEYSEDEVTEAGNDIEDITDFGAVLGLLPPPSEEVTEAGNDRKFFHPPGEISPK